MSSWKKKSCKKARSDSLDKISDLPDNILIDILSLLETIDAVRTCILAQRWRDMWKSIHSFSFNAEDIEQKLFTGSNQRQRRINDIKKGKNKVREANKLINDEFIKFVNRVLLLNLTSSIQSFSLSCGQPEEWTVDDTLFAIDTWISTVVSRNVEIISLNLAISGAICLPSCLFTCDTLTALYLTTSLMYPNFEIPRMIHLPRLKKMDLSYVKLCDANATSQLFLCSPVLEYLLIYNCLLHEDMPILDISCQSLKTLDIQCDFRTCNLSLNAPLLEEIWFDGELHGSPVFNCLSLQRASINCDPSNTTNGFDEVAVSKILNSVDMAEFISISYFCFKVLKKNFKKNAKSPFPNVKWLSIGADSSKLSWEIIVHFIKINLELEHLIVSLVDQNEKEKLGDLSLISSSHLKNLRNIEVRNFKGSASEFCFLKYVLATQSRLEKVIIKSECPSLKPEDVSKELFDYPSISPKLSILTSHVLNLEKA